MDISSWMAFRVVAKTVYENILKPEAESTKLFTALDYPLPYLGAEAVLNNRRAVSVYYGEGDLKKGSIYRPQHKPTFLIDLFVSADAKADLEVLEKQFEGELDQTAKRSAMKLMVRGERRANFLIDELIDITYQIIMRKENDQLGVDRLEPSAGFTVANRMITEIAKGKVTRDKQTAALMTVRAQMLLECKFNEKVTGKPPVGAIGGGAEFWTELEINEDETTKAGVKSDTTT